MVFQQEVITNPRTELHTLQPQMKVALAQGAAAQSDVSKDLPLLIYSSIRKVQFGTSV